METTVNMRSKRTQTENAAIVAIWSNRKTMVTTRKDYETKIEMLNKSIQKELREMLTPVCTRFDIPIEFIIESNRCVVQVRMYSTPKAKNKWFVTNLSQNLAPLEYFMKDQKHLEQLQISVERAIRRIRKIANIKLGRFISPIEVNPSARIQDLKRRPDEPMIVVTYNVRTRYDF